MSETNGGVTDDVTVEVAPAEEALKELVARELAPGEVLEQGPTPEGLVDLGPAFPQKIVLDTEEAWTVQSQHGVLLDHFVPTQDYTAIEADPAERDVKEDDTW